MPTTPAPIVWTLKERDGVRLWVCSPAGYHCIVTGAAALAGYRLTVHFGGKAIGAHDERLSEAAAKSVALKMVRADMTLRLAAIEASIDADVTAIVEAPVGQTVGGR